MLIFCAKLSRYVTILRYINCNISGRSNARQTHKNSPTTANYHDGSKSIFAHLVPNNIFHLSSGTQNRCLFGIYKWFFAVTTQLRSGSVFFVIGAILWIWTYEQLVRLGEGSPSPVAGRTLNSPEPAYMPTAEIHPYLESYLDL